MGDEKDPSATSAPEAPPSVAPPAPVSVVPRPVSVVPRPASSAPPTSRMPLPPSSRGMVPGMPSAPTPTLGAPRTAPPPPPVRSSSHDAAARPSLGEPSGAAPRPIATPPAPAPLQRQPAPPGFSRPLTQPPSVSVTAQLEQRLGTAQIELRKLGSERHTLRARLRREADRLTELESALRAEKELRRHAADEHQAALAGLRTRLGELEATKDAEIARLCAELEQTRAAAARAEAARIAAEARASAASEAAAVPVCAADTRASAKLVQGLRRIRGIGPAYQRMLEQLGVTRVQQVAAWTEHELASFAEKLKIRADRIVKDDWVGQAKRLDPDPE
jgi:large subunit ribosomal protein L21